MVKRIAIFVSLLFCAFSLFEGNAFALSFDAAVNYPAGSQPQSVVVGDFNKDGKLDLAAPNYNGDTPSTVSVLLGKGDGTFNAAVNYPVGTKPVSVAVGDFNKDGNLDLAVANYNNGNPSTVSVLLGKADVPGTFNPAVSYAVGSGAHWVEVGDFNKDGNLDLAVANFGSADVSILLGKGDGTFNAAVNYAAGTQPVSLAVGDFNKDTNLDLAVANWGGGNVSVLLGNGDGTFPVTPVNYPAGSGPRCVTVGDFNKDGNLDLATSNYYDNNVSVLLGNGNGTFQTAANYDVGIGTSPAAVAVGDFNGDGNTDLAVPNFSTNKVAILLGNGTSTNTFQAAVTFDVGSNPLGVAVGTFDDDGKPDLAVADSAEGFDKVSVLLNTTAFQFRLTANATGTGGGTVQSSPAGISYSYPTFSTGQVTLDDVTAVTLTATAATGSTAAWTGNCDSTGGTSTTATCTINSMNSAKTVLATFTLNTYTVTASVVNPAGGSVTPPSRTVDYNATATFTVTTNTGYTASVSEGTLVGSTWTIPNVTSTHTATVAFTINTYTLTYTAGANGSISGSSPQTVNHGASGTAVTAVPATGYHFVQWSDASTANPRTDTNVTASITVTASFSINTYTLTYNAGANGSISGSSPQTVDHGASGTAVTAVPATNYHFVQWSDASTANPRTDTNVTANITVTASFAINTYTLTYNAGANGSISGASPQTVNHGASGTAVTAVPATGYHFVQWSDASTANPRTDTNVTVNITVTASFAINTYVDFDGDGKADIGIYRGGGWFIIPSSTGAFYGIGFGGDPSDIPIPGDYDGDGKADIAIYRNGGWFIIPSSTGAFYGVGFGGDPTDIPIPGDYDGDGKADIALYRQNIGAWYIVPSSTGVYYAAGFGGDPTDIPIPGDYDGDGKTDIAIYRKGAWYIIPSSTGAFYGVAFGGDPSDIPVPGDYDGDGKTDIAVYRKSIGAWYIILSSTDGVYAVGFGGGPSDVPITTNRASY